MATSALRVSRFLTLFWPYTGLLVIAFFLLKGREAPEIRNRVVIFTGSVVLALYLCTCWLILSGGFERPRLSIFAVPRLSFSGSVLAKPYLWRSTRAYLLLRANFLYDHGRIKEAR